MLISVLDAALIFYKLADWRHEEDHCFHRFEALALHSQTVQEYGQRIAMSDDLESLMYSSFPWDAASQGIGRLRDLMNFMLQDMQRAKYIVDTRVFAAIELEPAGVLCEHVEKPEIINAWEELLCSCMDAADPYESLIATWDTPAVCECRSVNLTMHDLDIGSDGQYDIPLVWDDDSWAVQLAKQDWWPDLQRCVELKFKTRYITHSMARKQPVPFECSSRFLRSLDQIRDDKQLQDDIVEALTKTVYGIHDTGLGYEIIRGTVRFRVTESRRVHGRMANGKLILEEFGGHRIDGIG